MGKRLKRLSALLLAMIMTAAMATAAFADEAYSITVTNTNSNVSIDGQTYSAYKLFNVDYSGNAVHYSYDASNCLNVSYTPSGAAAALSGDSLITWLSDNSRTDAEIRAFADYVYSNYAKNAAAAASATASGETATISLTAPGYYLVYGTAKDKDGNAVVKAAVSLTSAKPTATINPKIDAPSLTKEIKHNESNTWGTVGDNQIGDTVEFRTKTTVPNTANYTTYVYKIHDTMSAGLTSQVKAASDITIKVNDAGDALASSYYTVNAAPTDGCTFEVTVDVIKAIADGKMKTGDTLYTYYNATLNKDALIYDAGKQDNKAQLEYSNSPYDTNDTGKTEEHKVYDWTFKMGVNKTDASGNALTGAKFALSKNSGLGTIAADANGAPTSTADLIALIDNTDGTYTVAPVDYTGTKVYYLTAGNVTIKGLDDATDYYLYETKAPTGYNKLTAPVKFNISANSAYDTTGSTIDASKVTVSVADGAASSTLSTNVVNTTGSTLPSTGGIGTTVFYVIGTMMAGFAVVLFAARKKKSSETD